MTCKDCLHYCVCRQTVSDDNWPDTTPPEIKHMFSPDGCENFKPVADVKEARYGRWQWDVETYGDPMYGIDEDFGYRCSECQVWADEYGVDGDIYEEPPTHILQYCPNCGADMTGGNK